jgi:2-dehydropantoate 2-reductase
MRRSHRSRVCRRSRRRLRTNDALSAGCYVRRVQIIVLGAGAIGSLIGAKLSAQSEVILVGRGAHVRAINERGLVIHGVESRTVELRAFEQVESIGSNALVILTTKVPGSAAALSSIARLVREDTTILCLQNGLGAESVARDAVRGRCVVLRGITQLGAIFDQPGVINYMANGYTVIEQHERAQHIAMLFKGAGIETRISSDIRRDVWHKLILNCVVNPITTMIGSKVGAIADSQLDELKQLVINECLAVAGAEGLNFELDFQREIRDLYAASHNVVSMRQDLSRGRPTEIDYMNGAVAAVGARHGIACPVNAALAQIIKAMATRSLFPEKMLQPELS